MLHYIYSFCIDIKFLGKLLAEFNKNTWKFKQFEMPKNRNSHLVKGHAHGYIFNVANLVWLMFLLEVSKCFFYKSQNSYVWFEERNYLLNIGNPFLKSSQTGGICKCIWFFWCTHWYQTRSCCSGSVLKWLIQLIYQPQHVSLIFLLVCNICFRKMSKIKKTKKNLKGQWS